MTTAPHVESSQESPILIETHGRAGLIRLNRPKQLNALNDALMDALGQALLDFDANDDIAAIVITGNEKAFAAGMDIAPVKDLSFSEVFRSDMISRNWETLRSVRKPVIAAVNGFALGGGSELAMMCDLIIASETAKFAQPEVKLAIPPGAGGTQRTARALGKAKAMDLCLTGRMMDAAEAERCGLVSRVVPPEKLLEEALAVAQQMGQYALSTLMMIKECVNQAFEMPLSEGIRFERRMFHAAFATEDQKEGFAAFLEKRPAQFKNR
jgi:enoyl-CoA hydratase